LSLLQHDDSALRWQAPVRSRPRICLLKGCEKWFCPDHPRSRYCTDACRDAARDWSMWEAARRYRATEHGKERRRQQSRRYRQRVRERRREAAAAEQTLPCEGHQEADDSEKIPCCRPGCYELFSPEPRSPLKKFCCALCREALRRVRQREARWGWRRLDLSEEDRWERFRGPPTGFD
jgi:hypothetical protein